MIQSPSVYLIRISFYADPDPEPGSQKCPYGSKSKPLIFYSDPDPKGVKKLKKTTYTNKFSPTFFITTLKI